VSKAVIADIFRAFLTRVASTKRPLYFHTDDTKLRKLFTLVQAEVGGPLPSILPNE